MKYTAPTVTSIEGGGIAPRGVCAIRTCDAGTFTCSKPFSCAAFSCKKKYVAK